MSTPNAARGVTLLVTLSIVCAVLLIATVTFGVSTLLVSNAAARPAPTSTKSPKPTEKPADADRVVQGREVEVVSDLDFGYFFMSTTDAHGYTALYSQISNTDAKRAATAFFDVSLYDEDDTLVSRWSANAYLLPGQATLFFSVLAENMLDVASIRVEQTSFELDAPIVTGTVVLDEMRGGDGGVVEGTFTSTLSAPAEYTEVAILGTVDGEVFALCTDFVDVPANGTFTARCTLEPTSRNEPEPIGDFPDEAFFSAFYTLDTPL
ncbi:hypothetical protein QF046_001994 [Microbacterium sp. W4I4]|uniref:hypothetical protein n=1 Tax=Microbacterium sp. W4I4 TaxID=3042295 RepID=UPI0027821C14|nr:hypothetical protein [Microbacterium sp. W4I4]MDQ0614353.1 hypothetical protein [Microbacterium sp. W4I4]